MENTKPIRSFRDLDVYQRLFNAAIVTLKEITPKLPADERYDLIDQIRRACKSAVALIAEGYAKRHQVKNWHKYIDDAIGECNEMIVHLSFALEIYPKHIEVKTCQTLIAQYDIAGKQLYNLKKTWKINRPPNS